MSTSALLQVPAFPPVATKLLRVASSDEADIADLVHLLRSDPVLSAEIIRYANSPLFLFRTDVKTLEHAVVLLGTRNVRSRALAAVMRTFLGASLIMDELRSYWRYSVACALLAEKIAPFGQVSADTAYAAALLHDIGRLGLLVAHPTRYPLLLQMATSELREGKPFDVLEQERSLLGIDRYDAGAWLARKWNLPAELCATAGKYDAQAAEEGPALVRVVLNACRIASSVGLNMVDNPHKWSYEKIREGLPPELAAHLPRRAEDLRAHIEREIAALDWDPCDREQESAAQMLLNLASEPPEPAAVERGAKPVTPSALQKSRIWPWLVAGATLLALAFAVWSLLDAV